MNRRNSLVQVAGQRLVLSLGLLVLLLAVGSAGLYRIALHKAASERAEDLVGHYSARLSDIERDWESQSRAYRARIEYARPFQQGPSAAAGLQVLLTLQEGDRHFRYLLIQSRDGRKLFESGDDLALPAIPDSAGEPLGHYLNPDDGRLYRVFEQPIRLGGDEDDSRFAVFFRIDDTLLHRISAPGTTLSVFHEGEPVASSGGPPAIERLRRGERAADAQTREIAWGGNDGDPIRLHVEAPVKTLFTTAELTLAVSAIPLVDGLVLWFTLGMWLLRQAGRASALGRAVRDYAATRQTGESFRATLAVARQGSDDEIAEVADAIGALAAAIDERERAREQVAAQLRASEARIREVTSALADGVLVVDTDGLVTFVNPEAQRLLGWPEPELLGRDSHATFHHRTPAGDHLPAAACRIHHAIRAGQSFRDKLDWFVRRDGSLLPVSVAATPIRRDEAVAGAVVTFQDISERLAAEQALKQSEERLALATRSGGIGIWDWNVAADQLVWDDSMFLLYGLSRQDFSGAYDAWRRSLHPDDRERLDGELRAALAGNRPYDTEFRVVRGDGEVRHIKAQAQVFRDAQGNAVRVVGTNWDITAQHRASREIAELAEFNSKIISESTLGMVVYRAEGACVLANEAAARIVGATTAQVLAQNFREIRSWRESGLLPAALRALESGEKQHMEAHLNTTFGREVWVDSYFIPLTRGGEPHLLLILSDVSGFRLAQMAMSDARREAERANRAKSDFLANMSHEIRTPMNAIIGLSGLALGNADLPPKLRDYLSKIHTSSRALLSIINDILDYSKVEAGRLELDAVEFRLEEVLRNVADLFAVRAEEKGLEMVFDVAPTIPPVLVGDPLRLGQVMNNLVGNAVKFTDRGEVHIRVEELERVGGAVALRVSVRDTGIGMDEEQLSRLFQAFTQADGSITRRFGGTGLGLVISKRLVERMGGDIQASSAPGQGSRFTFTIRLPIAERAEGERPASGLRGMRILVVDDLDTSRQTLAEILATWGLQVTEAASGPEALARLAERADRAGEAFELVLLDWVMPDMDGISVARHIQEQSREGPPVVIMVTAHSRERLLEAAAGVRLDAVLTKPVTPSGLLDTIVGLQGGGQIPAAARGIPPPELPEQAAAIRGARVLLVEDNAINQTVAQDMLARLGLHVTTADDGREALDLLERECFDAVLMDLQMPVMDGLEATRRIRAQERLRDLPVIAMTAAALPKDREASRAAGMNDHLAKPILGDELVATLVKWLRPACAEAAASPAPGPGPAAAPLPAELPGFDLAQALARLGGNRALFRRLVQQFGEQFGGAAALLARRLEAGDAAAAAALAHQIKGAAGNLGAMALHRAAAALEEGLRAGQGEGPRALFEQALAQVLRSAASLAEAQAAADPAAADFPCDRCRPQEAIALFRQLRELVDGSDFVPHELLAQLKASVACRPLREQLDELGRHIDNTDYDKAAALLGTLACIRGHDLGNRPNG